MSKKEKENNILLDSHGDLFGLEANEVFNHHSENANIVRLRIDNPRRLELTQSRYHSDVELWLSDDIEQLEKLVEWVKLLHKGAKKHIKKLQKVEVESST